METYKIDILNPKALKLLQNLADLKLISMKKSKKEGLTEIIDRLRKKASQDPPLLDEITEEVEAVRSERYDQKG